MSFTLPDLPYAFDALTPHIDAKTMEIHHDKHHGGYVAKLNAALEKLPALSGKSIEELLVSLDAVPVELRAVVRNNGGGHYNHSLFWRILSPKGGGEPGGALAEAIRRDLGGFGPFKEQFSASAAGVFGSGWAWLAADSSKHLSIVTTPNQDSPLSLGFKPILGLDVWEHAYYLTYQNRRPDYIAAFWNLVDWRAAEKNLELA